MKISIVTNAYNQGRFLRKCMNSVLNQSYRDIEYIVVEPGSTDETPAILAEYEALSDERLKILREPDEGPADGLNKGFSIATGDWFAYLNADDFYLQGALEQAVGEIVASTSTDCIYANGLMADQNGVPFKRVISTSFDARSFVRGRSLVLQQSTFWKASSFRKLGGFNVQNRTSWDAELLLDMSLAGMKLKPVSGYWSAFVIHPESITGSQRLADESFRNHERMFRKVMGRDRTQGDLILRKLNGILGKVTRPKATMLRLYDELNPGGLSKIVGSI